MINMLKRIFKLNKSDEKKCLVYIHDHKFKLSPDNKFYTDGKFTNELFNRYIFSDEDKIQTE